MSIEQTCPLCEKPARFEPVGFPAPKRHYMCACSEFVVEESGAKWLATLGNEHNQGIIETAKIYSDEEHICVITLNRKGSALDFILSKGIREEVLR